MENSTKKIIRTHEGEVVSDKGDKTIVVRVDRTVLDPKYRKRRRVSKRYQVHDEKNEHHIGERVKFVECRPISKHKRWRVVEKI
jgi:small subunit ribosomal protein S17